jgi:cell division protein FtsI/penicillin-binding protein 2
VKKGDEKKNPDVKDHAWFVSFAPVNDPKIAVVVLVENGGFGGLVAAPVAKAVYEAVFRDRPSVSSPATTVEAPASELED